ncbi:type II toxin-antitoxin system HicA family toxin [Cellulomonas cellasea]|uniref:type II toxin-antitoxin system HicA family toxin n=1 Tax=Cellulomonas cellasea TaxID=43670 RepID=UPI0025A3F9A5|nr:type II toxin-antitoxin system HicA family toxin [Cellulomonas cellasea]MDM8084178.1 type II toxin-antitoxin system HicA family toxin [Cellulomonas cellasea]
MIAEQPTRKVSRELRAAGFEPIRTVGSHTWWQHPGGVGVAVPDGHRTISPGVYRKILKAMEAAR